MIDPTHPHYSFIVRCRRDANGTLRGTVIDASSQRSYQFANHEEMTDLIESLTRETPKDKDPSPEMEEVKHLERYLLNTSQPNKRRKP